MESVIATIYFQEFITLAVMHFLVVVVPGPDFTITVSQSVRFGKKIGLYTALGLGCGTSLHVFYTLLGMGALIHASATLMSAAKIAGAGYLFYMGWQLLRTAPQLADNTNVAAATHGQSTRCAFWRGFINTASNPKASMFFLIIFTTLVSINTPLKIQFLYSIWICLVNTAWFALVSLMFSKASVRQSFLRMNHWFERSMGLVLIAFAVRLLFWL